MAQTLLLVGTDKNGIQSFAKNYVKDFSTNFDLLVFDAEENKGIELVREVIKNSFRKPFESKLVTVLLLGADKLTLEAQNALLKLIEEPPEQTQIILTSTNKNRLLPTVTSRCLEVFVPNKENNQAEIEIFSNFFEQSFGKKLEILEKSTIESYLSYLQQLLIERINVSNNSLDLSQLIYKIKLTLKLCKASQSSANKKLLALILAQN